MYWKTIKDIKITNLQKCLFKLKKKYIVSPWIEDIVKKNKTRKYKKSKIVHLYRISVKSLGFNKTVNDYYNVIDVITNEEGYVNKDYVELGKEIVVKEDTGNFKVTGVSDNPELSKVNIFNNTKVKASIKMGASNYLFSPYEKRDLNIPPGEYKIIVSSPNVIPFIEKVEFESGKNYMREYITIKTNKN